MARQLGIMVGGSAGGNTFAALQLARTLEEPAVVVVILCDSGIKYLSKIFNDDWMKEQGYLQPNGEPASYSVKHLQRMYRVYKRMYSRKIKERFKLTSA